MIFPTTWELLFPNWNVATAIGLFVMIASILALFIQGMLPFKVRIVQKWSIIGLIVGFLVMEGYSMLEDFATSTGGSFLLIGTAIVIVVGLILFWEPKKTGG